ncbi:MAG: DUF370 domain-containing protein [Peptococcaceae bacterium]|jgi:regulator of extracellular matrix RemA (YlzA/DUF370 family)|nr:DUF370 domain-containing protein [Peptococcaceae bacterium]MEE0207388.1 DUF370 domain-containing protein [Peptococcaceae bacterium]
MTFLNIGFDNMVATDKIVAIVSPEGASVKRLVQYARENHRLIDVSSGRKTRAVVITSDDYILLSAIQTDTLAGRMND